MDSGSSKGFDFASDDILCSYEDYTNQENSNGSHADSAIATNSSKEFNKSRMSRPTFPASSYSPPDDSGNQDVVIAAVERSMKKHSENLMRFLEGLSSRLSQLELYCYNVDKSVGEMRSDLARDHGESETKLKFLEKHLQEVHRSVQIIRDKQELADTQKELAKLQLAHKEPEKAEEVSTPSSDKRNDNPPDVHNQQLALALPQPPPAAHQPPMTQQQTYYLSPSPAPPQPNMPQSHYLQPAHITKPKSANHRHSPAPKCPNHHRHNNSSSSGPNRCNNPPPLDRRHRVKSSRRIFQVNKSTPPLPNPSKPPCRRLTPASSNPPTAGQTPLSRHRSI